MFYHTSTTRREKGYCFSSRRAIPNTVTPYGSGMSLARNHRDFQNAGVAHLRSFDCINTTYKVIRSVKGTREILKRDFNNKNRKH